MLKPHGICTIHFNRNGIKIFRFTHCTPPQHHHFSLVLPLLGIGLSSILFNFLVLYVIAATFTISSTQYAIEWSGFLWPAHSSALFQWPSSHRGRCPTQLHLRSLVYGSRCLTLRSDIGVSCYELYPEVCYRALHAP